MSEILFNYDTGVIDSLLQTGDPGVSDVSRTTPIYGVGIHGPVGVRCLSTGGTGSQFRAPLDGLTDSNSHSGSIYLRNNVSGSTDSQTLLVLSLSTNGNVGKIRRESGSGQFTVQCGQQTGDLPTGVYMPDQAPVRIDYQFVRSGENVSWTVRFYITNPEGTVPDAETTASGTDSRTQYDVTNLSISSYGGGTADRDVTFDTVRLYDGLLWPEPFAPDTPPTSNATVRSLISNVSNDEMKVVASMTGATSVRMAVSQSSDMSNPQYTSSSTPDTYGKLRFTLGGLSSYSKYYYQMLDTPSGGEESPVGAIGEIRTLPAPNTPAAFSVVLGSCIKSGSDGTAVNNAAAWEPDFLVHVGDYHYKATSAEVEANHISDYDAQTETDAPGLKEFLQKTPLFYVRSDHEAGADNADSDNNLTVVSLAAQEKVFPATLADTRSPVRARYQTWVAGRVRFIMLDMRTPDRSPGLNTDDSNKTMLGAVQKQWLKDMLLESEPVKVIIDDVAWSGAASLANGEDKWWAYDTERQEIADFITSNNIRVDFWHGDSHFIAADETHNVWGGFPVLCGSPFYSAGGGRNQSYFDYLYTTNQTSTAQQYMRITFDDDGTVITRTAVGWDAVTNTQKFVQTITWNTETGDVSITIWDGSSEINIASISLWTGTEEVSINPVVN